MPPLKMDVNPRRKCTACKHGTRLVGYLLMLLFVFSKTGPQAYAQAREADEQKAHGLGVLAGPTSGTTFKWIRTDPSRLPNIASVDLNLSFNLEGYLLVTSHFLRETPLPESAMILYLGPGLAFGTEKGDPFWGFSTNIGGYFVLSRYEIFLQLMPRLTLLPEREGGFGASVGLRYQF